MSPEISLSSLTLKVESCVLQSHSVAVPPDHKLTKTIATQFTPPSNIAIMSEQEQSPNVANKPEEQAPSEHLNIKVTDNNNEVFFKIKRTTALKKLMDAFCDRQGKMPNTVRFLFDGSRVNPTDSPESVSF